MVEWGRYQDAYKALWEKLDALSKSLGSVVFDAMSETWIEPQTLIAYRDELILCVGGGSGNLPGVWVTTDGITWKRKYAKVPSDWWASQIFNGKLYLGGGYGADFCQITEYDGTDFVEVFKEPGGLGGGQGCIEALGVYNNHLYAGRKNQIWRSADGRNWTQIFTFATNKGIYQFAETAGGFLAFEGEPISAPSKVYRTVDGLNWSEWASVNDVEWFRSHSPSDRIKLGGFCFIGDGKGYVFMREFDIWNSQFFRTFSEEGSNAVAIKCKRIGNYMGICTGMGTGHKPKGQFLLWDANCLRLIAETPMSIIDFELFMGNLYLACIGIVKDSFNQDSFANQLILFRLPFNIAESKPFMMTIPLFQNRVIGVAGYGAGWIPILGFRDVMVKIFSTQAGVLKFQAFHQPSWNWRDVETLNIAANTEIHETVTWRSKFMRLFFTPNAEATVSLEATLIGG